MVGLLGRAVRPGDTHLVPVGASLCTPTIVSSGPLWKFKLSCGVIASKSKYVGPYTGPLRGSVKTATSERMSSAPVRGKKSSRLKAQLLPQLLGS